MTGKARERNVNAEAGVKMLFENFGKVVQDHGFKKGGNQPADKLFGSISQPPNMQGRHALRGDAVSEFARKATLLGSSVGFSSGNVVSKRELAFLEGPKLDLGIDTSTTVALKGFLGEARAGDTQGAATKLAVVVRQIIVNGGADQKTKTALALSEGVDVRRQMREALAGYQGDGAPAADATVDALVDAAFEKIASDLLGTQQAGTMPLADGTQPSKSLPVIDLPSGRFEPQCKLGEGSFAEVYLYAKQGDPTSTVAVKLGKAPLASGTDDADAIHEARVGKGNIIGEAVAHQASAANGAGNVIKLESLVRCGEGRIAIVMENAPNGNVNGVAANIRKLVGTQAGQITATQVKAVQLTLLKDMLTGLREMHANGQMHLDMKNANCMIDANGRAKLADFGTTREGTQIEARDMEKGIDNERYLPPEYLDYLKDRGDAASNAGQAFTTKVGNDLNAIFPGKSQDALMATADSIARVMLEKVRSDAIEAVNGTVAVSHDTWGVGTSAIELFTGFEILPHEAFSSERWSKIVDWAGKPNAQVVGPVAAGPNDPPTLMRSTGDADVDDLINKLMHPKPDQRISINQALQHPAFNKSGIGDPKLREFIPTLVNATNALGKLAAADSPRSELQNTVRNRLLNVASNFNDAERAMLADRTKPLRSSDVAAMMAKIPNPSTDASAQNARFLTRLQDHEASLASFQPAITAAATHLANNKAEFAARVA